jgi:uncharacterized protein with HEPN domain
MSDTAQREWRFHLDDMIGFAEKVIAYTKGMDQDGFVTIRGDVPVLLPRLIALRGIVS